MKKATSVLCLCVVFNVFSMWFSDEQTGEAARCHLQTLPPGFHSTKTIERQILDSFWEICGGEFDCSNMSHDKYAISEFIVQFQSNKITVVLNTGGTILEQLSKMHSYCELPHFWKDYTSYECQNAIFILLLFNVQKSSENNWNLYCAAQDLCYCCEQKKFWTLRARLLKYIYDSRLARSFVVFPDRDETRTPLDDLDALLKRTEGYERAKEEIEERLVGRALAFCDRARKE